MFASAAVFLAGLPCPSCSCTWIVWYVLPSEGRLVGRL
jgi:hypothetical protein